MILLPLWALLLLGFIMLPLLSTHHIASARSIPTPTQEVPTPLPTPSPTPPPTPSPTPSPTPLPTPSPTPSPTIRTLTSQQTQSETVNATGQGTTRGIQATGTVQIQNTDQSNTVNIAAGTIYTNNNGCTDNTLQISLDADVSLPPDTGGIGTPAPSVTVTIHVVLPGVAGNIQDCSSTDDAFYWNSISLYIHDINGGFSGGTDPQPYTFVQQSDIDNAANDLEAINQRNAIVGINNQLQQAGMHLVTNPQCSPNVTSDHVAGDHADTVNVRVDTTCTATAST